MTAVPVISEDAILSKVNEKSFARGRSYYESEMVESVVRRGDKLFAEVLGSEEDLYQVCVTLGEVDFSATCNCPYDWGGYCKHIVAVLLTWIHDGDAVEERTPIEDLLSQIANRRPEGTGVSYGRHGPGIVRND